MTLTNMITIRLSAEERLLYEAEAAYRKQSLSTYLRERFKKSETSSNDLQNLQRNFIGNSLNPSLPFSP